MMNLLPSQLNGRQPLYNKIKDMPSIIYRLTPERVFEGHTGCVNTVVWDESGCLILSGSDDQTVAITSAFTEGDLLCEKSTENDLGPVNEQVFRVKLNKATNILCAKFLPHSNNRKIVCAAKNGAVHFLEVEQPESYYRSLRPYDCHSATVYDIITLRDSPDCFMTCSHDRSVALFDSRTPKTYNKILLMHSPVSALAVHPIRSYEFAVGSTDGFTRIYDERKLGIADSDNPNSGPFIAVCRPLGLPSRSRPEGALMTDYGCLHVTSVEYNTMGDRDVGRYLLTSHMYDSVYLYDTWNREDQLDENRPRDLTRWDNSGRVGLRFGWNDTGPNSVASNNEPVAQSVFRSRWSRLRQSDKELLNSKAFTIMSNEFVSDELKSAPRYKELQYFTGHRNFRTVLKDASFWGENHIMSGSECGHVFIWRRNPPGIVHVLEADNRVVNRVKAHPTLPYFISSGIDSNIKLFTPISEEDASLEDEKLQQIIRENKKFTDLARSTACLPFWLLLGLHNSLRSNERNEPPEPANPDS